MLKTIRRGRSTRAGTRTRTGTGRTEGALRLADPRFAAPMLAAFLVIAFLIGGGSRYDIVAQPILRFLACCAIGFALYGLGRADFARFRAVWIPFALFTAWMALQLVPLPFGIWSALPGRAPLVEAGLAVGLVEPWRPISTVPWRTANALLALTVPWAALLLAMRPGALDAALLPRVVIGIGIASASLGLLQLAGPDDSALYLYRITNEGSAVGLFANRNHNAAFLAACLPLLGLAARQALGSETRRGRAKKSANPVVARLVITGSIAALIVLGILATGSRGGILAMGLGMLAGLAIAAHPAKRETAQRTVSTRPFWIAGLIVLAVIAFALFGRVEALERLQDLDQADELRLLIWGPIFTLVERFGWSGAGFGTLPDVYQIVEPRALLGPLLVNHAHNDWLEVAVEGGVPALLVLAGGAAAIGWAALRRWRARREQPLDGAALLAFGAVLVIFAVFSIADYPLRTPSLAALFLLSAAAIVGGGNRNKLLAPGASIDGSPDARAHEGRGS